MLLQLLAHLTPKGRGKWVPRRWEQPPTHPGTLLTCWSSLGRVHREAPRIAPTPPPRKVNEERKEKKKKELN